MKPDDSKISAFQARKIRDEADKVLKKAGAYGVFPTPISDIIDAADIIEGAEDVLDETLLEKLRHKGEKALKSALQKIVGIFHAGARVIYVDRRLPDIKKVFLRLHEVGHGWLPWQRDIYGVIEDDKDNLAPDVAELFEREANNFATEVLFQLDTFMEEAADFQFGIRVPMDLSKKYGASIYSTIRRYVSSNNRNCAVLVLNPPEPCQGDGFRASTRRFVASRRFLEYFGSPTFPDHITPDHYLGDLVPLNGRKMSKPKNITIPNQRGEDAECVAEAFFNSHQVFILIHSSESLAASKVFF